MDILNLIKPISYSSPMCLFNWIFALKILMLSGFCVWILIKISARSLNHLYFVSHSLMTLLHSLHLHNFSAYRFCFWLNWFIHFIIFCFIHLFFLSISYDRFLFIFVSSSTRIVISGIPLHARFDDIEPLLKPYGKVEHCDAVSSKDPNTQTVHITYETVEQAQRYFLVAVLFFSQNKIKTNFE